jgi:general nucleoside transport system permease protein
MSAQPVELPRWADAFLVPAITVVAALIASSIVILAIGENPLTVIGIIIDGALGSGRGFGRTMFYTTSFIFVGLAVALAFQAGLFNIGGEGQAVIGGMFAALAMMALGTSAPAFLVLLAGIVAGIIGGAVWGVIPGYLQAKRGSHVVVTTIMFNFIASALLLYVFNNYLKKPGQMSLETEAFAGGSKIPSMQDVFAFFGMEIARSPWNMSFFLALFMAWLVWFVIWRTQFGYEMRVVGASETAARYAGISPTRITILAMALSGGLAGLYVVNEAMGFKGYLTNDFVGGIGFVGIAVALMGRAHPVGVLLASLLFGILYQGGEELAFATNNRLNRDMVLAIQGFVILFTGGMEFVFKKPLARLLVRASRQETARA